MVLLGAGTFTVCASLTQPRPSYVPPPQRSRRAHRTDALARLRRRQVLQEAPCQLPEPLLVPFLGVHGPAQRVPQLGQQHLHLRVRVGGCVGRG